MELYKEILINFLDKQISDNYISIDFNEIVHDECYKALKKIKTVIEDDSLNDEECFMKIEEIVRVFEKMGSNGGNRHDFG